MLKSELYDKAYDLGVEAERLSRMAHEIAQSSEHGHPRAVELRKRVHALYQQMDAVYATIRKMNDEEQR